MRTEKKLQMKKFKLQKHAAMKNKLKIFTVTKKFILLTKT
jgi:hypothetical protein